jgi:hypothetical protein
MNGNRTGLWKTFSAGLALPQLQEHSRLPATIWRLARERNSRFYGISSRMMRAL